MTKIINDIGTNKRRDLLEQIQEIKRYHAFLQTITNHNISLEEAAMEWIKLFAREYREDTYTGFQKRIARDNDRSTVQ